ncbi:MAG: dihydrolipoyl dehydrogenase [Alphaproteobacteria bacterium]|nr:dihydrolipoyl dehydrogenase [Alphaproteobacteria bacterium]
MDRLSTDVLIIGGGPAGYVAAIRAAQLGLEVTLVEKRATLGGVCLNEGCIPSKTLLDISHKLSQAQHDFQDQGILVDNVRANIAQMMKRKNAVVDDLARGITYLMNKNKVRVVQGTASFISPQVISVSQKSGEPLKIQGRRVVIATGSRPATLDGVHTDGTQIITSTEALNLIKAPKHLVVVGGGVIGLELGSVWSRLGSNVTVLEYSNFIGGHIDRECSQALEKALVKQGLVFKKNRKVTAIKKNARFVTIQAVDPANEKGAADIIESDCALICVGRRPNIQGLGIENIGVDFDPKGNIAVNQNYETSIPGVYAIGDIIAGPQLAHKAEEEGIALMEYFAGLPFHVNYNVIPNVIYTHPEVASVGFSEENLKASGVPYKVGKFPFSANSRAKAVGSYEGFVKILADPSSDKLLGVHIVGEMAGTLIAEAALAMEFGGSAEDIARTCHAHPTHPEALKEAAWATFGKALHL